jgi:hypothetical protein
MQDALSPVVNKEKSNLLQELLMFEQ